MQIEKSNTKGITLIALVITIIVLIILATVSINLVLGDGGIIRQAEKAAEVQANAEKQDAQLLDSLSQRIDEMLTNRDKVTNPYKDVQWTYAWVQKSGVWDNNMLIGGEDEIPEDAEIVAYFYKQNNKVQPKALNMNSEIEFEEDYAYKMVIEGSGNMQTLVITSGGMNLENVTAVYAWQQQTFAYMQAYMMESVDLPEVLVPYVTELTVCDGITGIGPVTLMGATSLSRLQMADSIITIGEFSFASCNSLTQLNVPRNVTVLKEGCFLACTELTKVTMGNEIESIEDAAFVGCEKLKDVKLSNKVESLGDDCFCNCNAMEIIVIPATVEYIGAEAFGGCEKLKNVYIESEQENLYIGGVSFSGIAANSTIYVRSAEIAAKFEDGSSIYTDYLTTISDVYDWVAPSN